MLTTTVTTVTGFSVTSRVTFLTTTTGFCRGSTAVKGDVLVDVIPERVQEFYINSWD